MEIIINWIGVHIIEIFTVLLVCITGYYAHLTQRLVKANNTPTIAIYLWPDEENFQEVNLCIENIGTALAHDIRFTTDLSFKTDFSFYSLGDVSFIKHGIKYLPPGKVYSYSLYQRDRLHELKQTSLEIAVTYKDSRKKKNEDCFCLNFSEIEFSPHGGSPLFKIDRSLKDINQSIKVSRGL